MTRLLKRSLLLLLIGFIVLLAPNYIGEQGYVLISFAGWTAEGSVVSYLVVLVISALLLALTWRLIKYFIYMVVLPSKWWRSRHTRTHANYFQAGIDFMTLGMWQQASEQFLRVKSVSKFHTAQELALVCAIRANDAELLEKVKKQAKLEGDLPALTSLTNLVQQQQYAEALVELNKLDMNLLKLELPLKQLWLDIQLQNFNFSLAVKHLVKLDKQVAKQNDLAVKQEWQLFLQNSFARAMANFVKAHSVSQLVNQWQSFAKAVQQLEPVLSAYISVLSDAKQLQPIEQLLLANWRQHKQTWLVDNLRICYQQTKRVHMDKLFVQVQKAATHNSGTSSDNKTLLTAYAYLAAGQKDNQLAKQALEQVIYSNNNRQDFILYADVLAELGEVRHSIEMYQQINAN